MKESDLQQIKMILENFIENKKYIPYFSDLLNHKIYWDLFKQLNTKEAKEIKEFINSFIRFKIEKLKTKWWVLFRRFFENNQDIFWEFRFLNENKKLTKQEEILFQNIWKRIESELFKLEWILTQAMIKKPQWLWKVVDSFYNIVYLFFPRFSEIK